MTVLTENIKKLKLMTCERQINFQQAFDYFLTNIGENKALDKHFKSVNGHKILKPALTRLGQSVYGNNTAVSNIILLQLKEENFFHGTVQFSNHVFWALYFFEDILSGIACNVFSAMQGQTDYYRLEMFIPDKQSAKM